MHKKTINTLSLAALALLGAKAPFIDRCAKSQISDSKKSPVLLPSDKQILKQKTLHSFCIKGIPIQAFSKKDAIKRYNHLKHNII